MPSYGQTITITYRAYVGTTNAGQPGDVANHTLRLVADGVSSAPTNAPAEVDATNAPGIYKLVLTAAEAQHNVVTLCGKSSTGGVIIQPQTVTFERLPTATPGSAGGLLIDGVNTGPVTFNAGMTIHSPDGVALVINTDADIQAIVVLNNNSTSAPAIIVTSPGLAAAAFTGSGVTGAGIVADGPSGGIFAQATAGNTNAYVGVPSGAGHVIDANVSGGLSGPSSVTLTFHDSLGAAVPNVLFTVLGQGSAQANTSGVAAFGLPNGTYTVAAAPTGTVLFSNATLTVSGTTALTITGHSASIPTPPSPAQTTAYGVTRDPHGSPKGSVPVTFQLRNADQTADVYDGGEFTSTSDSSGNLQVTLLKSAAYRIKTATGKYVEFTTSSDSTQPLPNVLGGFT